MQEERELSRTPHPDLAKDLEVATWRLGDCRTRVSGWVRGHCRRGRGREPGLWAAGGSRAKEARSCSHSDRVSGPDEGREGQADCVGALQKGTGPGALERGGTEPQGNSWRPGRNRCRESHRAGSQVDEPQVGPGGQARGSRYPRRSRVGPMPSTMRPTAEPPLSFVV